MTSIYIVRGVLGSGKTIFGLRLKAGGLVRWVISADDYMVDDDGTYAFDPKRLSHCHSQCQADTLKRLKDGESVAVCNTFTRIWEMQPYVDMARNMSLTLYVIKCEGRFKNIHGVPQDKVESMRERFEDWDG